MKGRVTERDLEIVTWLGRHRLATAEQVMRRFGMHRSKAYERLRVVAAAGLVRHEEGVRSARIYLATRTGLETCGICLTAATVSAASFEHDMRVLDVAISLEADPTLTVLSEREIRRIDHGVVNPVYRIPMFAGSDNDRGFWPDLVAERVTTGMRFAIEVELSLKKAERLENKLRSYRRAEYGRILYLAGSAAVATAVTKAVTASYLGNVDVRPLSDLSAVPAGEVTESLAQLRQEITRLRCALSRQSSKQVGSTP